MAKPILIARIPYQHKEGVDNGEYSRKIGKALDAQLNFEYHILIILQDVEKETTFEALNSHDLPPIDMKQLTELAKEAYESTIV